MAGFDDLLHLLPSMDLPDLHRLGKAVEQAVRTKRAAALADPANRPRCPHCKAGVPWRWGKASDVPRWRCRACKKTFMKPFRGPATRHLPLYVAWMAFRDQLRGASIVGNPLIDRLVRDTRRPNPTRKKAAP